MFCLAEPVRMIAADWLATCSGLIPPLNAAQSGFSLLLQSNQVTSPRLTYTHTNRHRLHTRFPSAPLPVPAAECS